MSQLALDFKEQKKELRRVSGKIAGVVALFFESMEVGEQFHAGDLHQFVSERAGIAPASADRVMRDMRRHKQINYSVIKRSESLYRKDCVEAES